METTATIGLLREALEELAFEAFISGDKDQIRGMQRILDKHNLGATWCASPLRITFKDSNE